ncbi:hypothetical protein CHARACLAT_030379 [Characodon lateralis]|uniref:Uncharacterized protein n=1 Tax=Characodon lateralis TaxID=208331 RepID=A0ABU7F798_9TELE|nr:hypothetical protein [Characodon lateralis]
MTSAQECGGLSHILKAAPQLAPAEASTGINLWQLLDNDAEDARKWKTATADAIEEVQQYFSAPPLDRAQNPLKYWAQQKTVSKPIPYANTPSISATCMTPSLFQWL